MARNPHKRRCTATTQSGSRCRNWAMRPTPGEDEDDPALCNVHAGLTPRPQETGEAESRRCTATTADGTRCASWALRATRDGDGPPLCNVHARGTALPDETEGAEGRRCTATTQRGSRCRKWALKDTAPPLCSNHVQGGGLPGEEETAAGRRCTGTTRQGRRCRRWAMPGAAQIHGRPLCNVHADGFRMPGPGERRCSAKTRAGEQCPHWAVWGTEETYGRLLCTLHVPQGDPNRFFTRLPQPGERRCTAKTRDGERCRCWAVAEDEQGQALCWPHAYPHEHPRIRHGYYRARPPLDEVEWEAIRLGRQSERPLDGEIVMARLLVDVVADYLNTSERPLREDLNSVRLIISNVRAVGKLLLARKELEAAKEEREHETRWFDGLEQLVARPAGEAQEIAAGEAHIADEAPAESGDGPAHAPANEASAEPNEEALALLEAARTEALSPEIDLVRDLLPQVLATTATARRGQEMVSAGKVVVRGTRAVAALVQARETLRPDPGAVWDAAMDRALDALSEELPFDV